MKEKGERYIGELAEKKREKENDVTVITSKKNRNN